MADEQALTDKEQLFVDLYLGKCWLNATAAAREAGYSNPNANGAEIRHRPHVAAVIKEKLAEHAMPPEEVLARLAEIARGEHTEFLIPLRGGRFRLDTKALIEAGKGHLVTGYKETETGPQVEFAKPIDALRDIGRYHKLFTDKTTVDITAAALTIREVVIERPAPAEAADGDPAEPLPD